MTLPPDFSEAIERARPRLGSLASSISFFPTIGSTNDVASSLAAGGGHEGAVVIAETQTAGRGRRGRRWFSPPGSGLYVSVVLRPSRAIGAGPRDRALTLARARPRGSGRDSHRPAQHQAERSAGWAAEGSPAFVEGVADGERSHSIVVGYGINVGRWRSRRSQRSGDLVGGGQRPVDRAPLRRTLAAFAARYGSRGISMLFSILARPCARQSRRTVTGTLPPDSSRHHGA